MYWRTVFECPFGFDAKRLSNEYAKATFGFGYLGNPSDSSWRNSVAIVPNSFSFHDGLSS